MRKLVLSLAAVAAAVLLSPLPASADFCSNCIINSASPQDAQFNVGTGTVRGSLTVGNLVLANFTGTNVTATNFFGGGLNLTGLNASNLGSGTVPSARVAGAYSGVTGLGTVASGAWQGSAVGTQYGGTGQNFATVNAGALPYFLATGVMATLPAPSFLGVLESTGPGAPPVWVSSPALNGANFSNIPLAALQTGALPTAITVADASLSAVAGVKITGNISGGAAFLTVPLPVGNLAPGTLPTTNAASSVTVTGVTPGTFGGPSQLMQATVGADGRITSVHQFTLTVPPPVIQPGPLPAGVTIGASAISSGTLANDVIASSVGANGTPAGSFGGAATALTLNVHGDGRIFNISQQAIALPPAQLQSGALPAGVTLAANQLTPGTWPSNLPVSSVAANGVAPGTYGNSSTFPVVTVGPDGRVTTITTLPFSGVTQASNTVTTDVNGYIPVGNFNPFIVTLVGNTFNGASQLVQLTGGGVLPALGAANLTNLTGANVVGPVASASALAAAGTAAPSGNVCRGVDASGNCLRAPVDANAVSGSTNPVQAGGLYTYEQAVAVSTTVHAAADAAAFATKASTGTDNSMVEADALQTVAPALTLKSTGTILGQDANGFSLAVSSGISAQCITLQGGQVCGPSIIVPGGAGGTIQFSSAGVFTGDSNFTWDPTGQIFTVAGAEFVGDVTSSGVVKAVSFTGDNTGNLTHVGYASYAMPAPSGVAATDTANILTAISASANGTIVFREGTYLISALINNGTTMKWIGQGKNATIIRADTSLASTQPTIHLFGNVEVRDMTFDANYPNRADSSTPADDFRFGAGSLLDNVSILNNVSRQAFITFGDGVRILNSNIDVGPSVHACSKVVSPIGTANMFIINSVITLAGTGGGSQSAISMAGGVFIGNTVNQNGTGSWTNGLNATSASLPMSVTGNRFISGLAGGGFTTAIRIGASFSTVSGNEATDTSLGTIITGANSYAAVNQGFSGGNTASGSHSAVSGGTGNTATASNSTIAGGAGNTASALDTTISGGDSNSLGANTDHSAIGGGSQNSITHASGGSGQYAVIGGGFQNTITGTGSQGGEMSFIGSGNSNSLSGDTSVIAGGSGNGASGSNSAIGGGSSNSASGDNSVIPGGRNNIASGPDSAVGGGDRNTASGTASVVAGGGDFSVPNSALGNYSSVGGGIGNSASGLGATVPGGSTNLAAGVGSFAAGTQAKALNDGSFVMADSRAIDLVDDTTDQMKLRFQGGFNLQTSSMDVINPSGTTLFRIDSSSAQITVPLYVGVSFSTVAAGGAGSLTSAVCPGGSFALGGRCSCSGGVAVTGVVNGLGPMTAGAMPTQYDCQESGGTGGSCAAAVLCSKIQF